jgi:hypothetical protein
MDIDPTKLDRATTNFYNVTVPSNAVKGLFDFGPPAHLEELLMDMIYSYPLYL